MSEYTWDTKTVTWGGDVALWASAAYPVSATFGTNGSTSVESTALFPVSANMTQVLLSELHEEDRVTLLNGTLASALGVSTSCVLVLPVSGSIQMISTATDSGSLQAVGLATLSSSQSTSSTNNTVFPATATFSSVLDNVDDEDKVTLISAALESSYGIISESVLKAVGSISLDSTTGFVNNINYPETATIATDVSTSSASNFLWNTETESSDTWSISTEETTTWTTQTEDDTTWT